MNKFHNRVRFKQGGFALGISLVIIAVSLTIAGGLALSRQMWGQMGEKQLHRILTQTAMDVDSMAILASIRNDIEQGGMVQISDDASYTDGFRHFVSRVSLTITPSVGDSPERSLYQGGVQVAMPAEFEEEGVFPLYPFVFFEEIEGGEAQDSDFALSVWDPFRGIYSVVTGFGVLVQSELGGDARKNKDVRPERDEDGKWVSGSRLHAWTQVDTAKYAEVIARFFPASAFTCYVPKRTDLSESAEETFSMGYWAARLPASDEGVGRYYFEGSVGSHYPGVFVDYPLIATGGLAWGDEDWNSNASGSWTLKVDHSGYSNNDGPVIITDAIRSDQKEKFWKYRYAKFGGMLAAGTDRPVRLHRFEGREVDASANAKVLGVNPLSGETSFFKSDTPNPYDPNIIAQMYERVTLRVERVSPDTFTISQAEDGPFTEAQLEKILTAFSSDDINAEILFDPSAWRSGPDPVYVPGNSISIYIVAGGVDAGGFNYTESELSQFSVRVVIPRVEDLWVTPPTNVGESGFALVTPHSLVIPSSGFNRNGGSVPTLLASPNIFVEGVPEVVTDIRGVVLTRGGQNTVADSPNGSAFSGPLDPLVRPSGVGLYGSLILWERTGLKYSLFGTSYLSSRVYPSELYLDGERYPPLTPAVMDVRVGREQLRTYRIFSEDTEVILDEEDDKEDEDAQ